MKSPAFSFYVRDWLASSTVATMTGDEVKAYMYLLCQAWLEEPRATLPTHDEALAKFARVSLPQWKRLKTRVLSQWKHGKCEKHKGRLYNERLLEVSMISESRAENRRNKHTTKPQQTIQQNANGLSAFREDEDETANANGKAAFLPGGAGGAE